MHAAVEVDVVGHALEDVRERQDGEADRALLDRQHVSSVATTLLVMLPCVSMAPFGLPVVPEV